MRRMGFVLGLLLLAQMTLAQTTRPAETRVPLSFSGGHDTDPRDGGRPVILVAAGLGVPAKVFRDAFKGVHPAHGNGGPTGDEARANKRVLLDALSQYGVTNDRLDEVSNRYRYRPQNGELWTNKAAEGYATVRDGKVATVTLTEAGNGYSSPPIITVKDHPETVVTPSLTYGKDLQTNGSVSAANIANQ